MATLSDALARAVAGERARKAPRSASAMMRALDQVQAQNARIADKMRELQYVEASGGVYKPARGRRAKTYKVAGSVHPSALGARRPRARPPLLAGSGFAPLSHSGFAGWRASHKGELAGLRAQKRALDDQIKALRKFGGQAREMQKAAVGPKGAQRGRRAAARKQAAIAAMSPSALLRHNAAAQLKQARAEAKSGRAAVKAAEKALRARNKALAASAKAAAKAS